MTRLGVVEFQDDGPPGLLGEWAGARGQELELCRLYRGDPLPDIASVDAVAILGASASVNDLHMPRRDELRAWVEALHAAAIPTLGICFGAQLVASVLGAPISRMTRPEIGWTKLQVTEGDDLGSGPWFEWHEDAIGEADALRVIARNDRGLQAYRAGPRVLGVQFHPEVTPAIVSDWIASDDGDLGAAETDADHVHSGTEAHHGSAVQSAYALFDEWWLSARRRAPD